MAACDACGKESDRFLYTCNECEKTLCSDHRLPEKHLCGLRDRATEANRQEESAEVEIGDSTGTGHSDGFEEVCAADGCTNRSDYGESYCPGCLNERDRRGGTQRRRFGKTDCSSPKCNNVASHGSTHCLDCRRAEQNESSGPPVEIKNVPEGAQETAGTERRDSILSAIVVRIRNGVVRISSAFGRLFGSS